MDLHGFIEERRPNWRRLEALLDQAERTGFKLSAKEANELGLLYRRASADLCRAQARTANAEVLRYLNGLVARAYGQIYSGRKFRLAELLFFFTDQFPALVRARARAVLLAAALLLAGLAFGFAAASLDEDARHFLVPESTREVTRKLDEVVQQHRARTLTPADSALTSSAIMTNNIRVCFMAFALGITFGFGTGVSLFYNGLLVGVLAAYFHRADYALHFWALILPHGVIELSAIFIAGAAGLTLGGALLDPGDLGRAQALRARGADAVRMVMGTVPMLVVAGAIEGFLTPQGAIPDTAKITFAAFTALLLAWYFAPRGTARRLLAGTAAPGAPRPGVV